MNLRVYRRNSKRIVVLWNKCPYILKSVYLDDKPIKFTPYSLPNKLDKSLVEGISINHIDNKLSPFEDYKLKFVFCNEKEEKVVELNVFSIKKNIMQINAYMYAYDYENDKWVPVPLSYFKK